MSKQKREIEIEVPDGWRIKEVVARTEDLYKPNTGTKTHFAWTEGKGFAYFTAILEPEPTHVKLAREVKRCEQGVPPTLIPVYLLADQVIAEWEASAK